MRDGLRKAAALCRQQDDRLAGGVALGFRRDVQRLDRGSQRLGLQHHAFAAAEGTVIDRAVTIMGEGAQIDRAYRRNPLPQSTRNDAVPQRAFKKIRKDGDDVDPQPVQPLACA